MGTRMVKLAMELYDAPWIQWYHEQMNLKKQSYILRYAGHHLGMNIDTIIDYYLYQNVSSLTQNAVRAILLVKLPDKSRNEHDSIY